MGYSDLCRYTCTIRPSAHADILRIYEEPKYSSSTMQTSQVSRTNLYLLLSSASQLIYQFRSITHVAFSDRCFSNQTWHPPWLAILVCILCLMHVLYHDELKGFSTVSTIEVCKKATNTLQIVSCILIQKIVIWCFDAVCFACALNVN